jgi:predicted CoA-binding protein
MTPQTAIDEFIAQDTLAVVGVSRDRRKFGNIVYRDLRDKGYRVLAVHPNHDTVEGDPCYPDLASLPERVDGIVVVVPPHVTEQIVREANAADIRRVWLQPGAESAAAIRYCEEHGISVIADECIMVQQAGLHFPTSPESRSPDVLKNANQLGQ